MKNIRLKVSNAFIMDIKKNSLLRGVLLGITIVFFVFACKKENKENIPVIPPVTSMTIDFSFISSEKDGSVSMSNWQYSTVSLALWKTILEVNCALPVTSFQNAIHQKGNYIDNDTWEWNYKFNWDSALISAKLQGKLIDDSVEWKLYIKQTSQAETSPEFLWLEGKSAYNQTGGWWLIYESPSNPNPYILINYSQNNNTTNYLKCSYIKSDAPEYGYFLENGLTGDPVFNVYYKMMLYNNNSILIELNKDNKEGHIKSELIYNDSNWHCWNTSLENISCN